MHAGRFHRCGSQSLELTYSPPYATTVTAPHNHSVRTRINSPADGREERKHRLSKINGAVNHDDATLTLIDFVPFVWLALWLGLPTARRATHYRISSGALPLL